MKVDLNKVIYAEKDATYTINYEQNTVCTTCEGSREARDSAPLECYACKGTGIKLDSLFQREQRCNTCKGFGTLTKKACKTCNGEGFVKQQVKKEIEFSKLIN